MTLPYITVFRYAMTRLSWLSHELTSTITEERRFIEELKRQAAAHDV